MDALLPQTQCTKCGHGGCRPYARAIVLDGAPIDRCPPGGRAGIALLAGITGREAGPLDPTCGAEAPRRIARIVGELCIGCTKCIEACPVDAIAGAPKRLHAVIPELCTGCDLCVAPCPVDCIVMEPPPLALAGWSRADADAARTRHEARARRLARLSRVGREPAPSHPQPGAPQPHDALAARADDGPASDAGAATDRDLVAARRRATVAAAIARARARREAAR